MIRLVIENIILFLLPAIVYFAYRYLRTADQAQRPSRAAMWNDAPLLYLFVAGAALVLAVMLSFATIEGGKPGQKYYPPRMENGKIVPGHYK